MQNISCPSIPLQQTIIGHANSEDQNPYKYATVVCHDEKGLVFSIQDPIYGHFGFLSHPQQSNPLQSQLHIQFSQLLFRLLFTCKAISRLAKIHQAGAAWLWNVSSWNVTRLQHSIGVMLLIRKLKPLDLEQQLAGLLHDISHTAFSHVIDYMLLNDKDDFHEGIIHEIVNAPNSKFYVSEISKDDASFHIDSILLKMMNPEESLMDILREFKMEHVMEKLMDTKTNHYTLLEMEFPQLCADRIDYTLRDQFCYHFHENVVKNDEEFFKIIEALKVVSFTCSKFKILNECTDHQQTIPIITFDDSHIQQAEYFMELYKQEVVDFFLGLDNLFSNDALAHLLRLCVQEKIISVEDMKWGDDERILSLVQHAVTQFDENSPLASQNVMNTIRELFKMFEKRKAHVLSKKKDDISNYVRVLSDDATDVADYSPTRKKKIFGFHNFE
ncbi:hypothetical protein FDP41_012260 [Naegleria fowleri]|uniref:HD/PDEase domain-containing protein n=1 Tax=Naegleria fowleri TaxID=5763 RepID=A0A6A5BU21_NAEFO|nr:uncharacterized protein FDP41_012260 [Naegleria fowleri]KAF0981603.1 hypothetical protein FDP41_012260 [Naegleria fowleri]